MGCSRVRWLAQDSNRTAVPLYGRIADRSGFVQYRKLLWPRGYSALTSSSSFPASIVRAFCSISPA
jgi:hypothetical protein